MTYPATVAVLGPVSYWRLGESAGLTAVDARALHDGTYTGGVVLGAAPGYDDVDTAATFGGTRYVDIASDARYSIATTGAMSWAAMMKPSGTGLGAAIGRGESGTWEWALCRGVEPFNSGTGAMFIAWQAGGSNYVSIGTASGVVPTGEWSQVVATVVAGVAAKIYVDGVLAGTSVAFAGATTPNIAHPNIGRRTDGGLVYAGDLDEIAIWDRELSASEVALLYRSGKLALTSRAYGF